MSRTAETVRVGSQWVERRGDHQGSILEVIRVTDVNVTFRHIKPGAASRRKESFDPSAEHILTIDKFLTLKTPYEGGTGTATQLRYRRVYQPKAQSIPAQPVSTRGNGKVSVNVPGLDVSMDMITPDLAKSWLDRGGINRGLKPTYVTVLAAAILRGEWKITGDTIKLDEEGRVRDGQHRLMAVIESQTPITTLVVRGISEDAFDVMDTGRSRSIVDVLHIRGYPNRMELGTTVRNLITYEKTGRISVDTKTSRTLVTPVTSLNYLQNHPSLLETINAAMVIRKANLPGGVGLWASLLELFKRADSQQGDEFLYRLVNGEGLDRGNPILVLRNRLLSEKRLWVTQTRKDREALAGAVINTWNAWRRKEQLGDWRLLRYSNTSARPEPFPVPI